MSSINDPEQLTGSSRIYANAKPGIIMEAFSMAGESNLVFIINELDKAANGKGNGNPADVLLTLLDNLGFTDNYMECTVPTFGVYPIATANDKEQISAPLMSRFAGGEEDHFLQICIAEGAEKDWTAGRRMHTHRRGTGCGGGDLFQHQWNP